jgi:Tfp pilus assembly protein PilW
MTTSELLVATVISLGLLGVAQGFFTTQQRAVAIQNAYAESQNVTRTFTDLMTRELRMASYDPSGTALTLSSGSPTCPSVRKGITEATATRLHFKQDLDGNGDTAGAGEDVVYYLSGTQIMRQDGTNAAVALVDGVPSGGLTFTYYNDQNPPGQLTLTGSPPALSSANRDCIAKVLIAVTAQLANPRFANIQPLISSIQTEVAIRNRSLTNTSY